MSKHCLTTSGQAVDERRQEVDKICAASTSVQPKRDTATVASVPDFENVSSWCLSTSISWLLGLPREGQVIRSERKTATDKIFH